MAFVIQKGSKTVVKKTEITFMKYFPGVARQRKQENPGYK
jgi:hypothetical protein